MSDLQVSQHVEIRAGFLEASKSNRSPKKWNYSQDQDLKIPFRKANHHHDQGDNDQWDGQKSQVFPLLTRP